jgi:two-component system, LytTR family, sensor kinase
MPPDGLSALPWNWLGHAAGAAIFAVFLRLLWQDRSGVTQAGRNKAMGAALCALLWNGLQLSAALLGENEWLGSLGAACLSLLPALLYDLDIHPSPAWAVRASYALSAAAALLHLLELAAPSSQTHAVGLYLIAAGFGCLALYAGWRGRRWQPALAVLLLALTFLHFDSNQPHYASLLEAVLHHAGIPLAMFVLLHDYRFVLLDALARPLADLILAFLFGAFAISLAGRSGHNPGPANWPALLLGMTCLLLVFSAARRWLQNALTSLLFRRASRDSLLAQLRALSGTECEVLDRANLLLAEYFRAATIPDVPQALLRSLTLQDRSQPLLTAASAALAPLRAQCGVEVVVPVPTTPEQTEFLLLGRRSEGRRYLSEDLAVLSRAAGELRDRCARIRATEMESLLARAELHSLQAQIHPHFLFNALNTLYALIPAAAKPARATVLNLSDVFRYLLARDKALVTVSEEVHIVKAYLEIESLRLGERLDYSISVAAGLEDCIVPLLSIEPLVENAVKHGVARLPGPGAVRVSVDLVSDSLRVAVFDSGPGFPASQDSSRPGGVGLENVRKRLALNYGSACGLQVACTPEGTTVSFGIPLAAAYGAQSDVREIRA